MMQIKLILYTPLDYTTTWVLLGLLGCTAVLKRNANHNQTPRRLLWAAAFHPTIPSSVQRSIIKSSELAALHTERENEYVPLLERVGKHGSVSTTKNSVRSVLGESGRIHHLPIIQPTLNLLGAPPYAWA